jgi:Fe2+ or Zn2+ uptake regulation protein
LIVGYCTHEFQEKHSNIVFMMTSSGKTENRNDPDLVQAFLKKWWVESDFKAPNLPLSLRLKCSGCQYYSIYNNTGTK